MTTAQIVLATRTLGARAVRDWPLGARTTYRVGGRAAIGVEVHNDDDLVAVSEASAQSGLPVLVIGNGSNMLVLDGGFPGIAVTLGSEFADIVVSRSTVVAGGAALLPVVARRSVAGGLSGFEWAVGVPGTIGGAVRMNAGGHGSDMAATLRRVRVWDVATGDHRSVPADELALGYRRSNLESHHVVTAAIMGLGPGQVETGTAALSEIVAWRRDNQPGGPNAGSVFTNPPDDSAGRLIDAAGLKGRRLGSARVSEKHANFIQADPDGRADDVLALMGVVARRVRETSGVELQAETRIVGRVGASS